MFLPRFLLIIKLHFKLTGYNNKVNTTKLFGTLECHLNNFNINMSPFLFSILFMTKCFTIILYKFIYLNANVNQNIDYNNYFTNLVNIGINIPERLFNN